MSRTLLQRLRSFEYLSLEHICVEAADRIEELEAIHENIKTVYETIDLNACVLKPRLLFDLTEAIYDKAALQANE